MSSKPCPNAPGVSGEHFISMAPNLTRTCRLAIGPGRTMMLLAMGLSSINAPSQQSVNEGARILDSFNKRVAVYMKLHNNARSEVHGLKPTSSPEKISHYEHDLQRRIRELRREAREGEMFTPEVAAEFRRLIGLAMQGTSAVRVKKSLNHAEPVHLPHLRVNHPYPEGIPLQSTPPSLLQNLPKLPQELEYRVVGRDLVLRDIDANLIVDVIRNLVP